MTTVFWEAKQLCIVFVVTRRKLVHFNLGGHLPWKGASLGPTSCNPHLKSKGFKQMLLYSSSH